MNSPFFGNNLSIMANLSGILGNYYSIPYSISTEDITSMFELPDFESAIPDTPIQLRSICKETFGHFWKDEAATCSGDFSLAGVLVTGLVFLTGWISV